jgi:hypothetical protein
LKRRDQVVVDGQEGNSQKRKEVIGVMQARRIISLKS